MNNKEKDILEKVKKNNDGLISDETLINSIAGADKKSVENLVALEYIQRIYQNREGIGDGTHTVNFYALTEKGLIYFASFYERLIYNLKTQTTFYVGATTVIISVLALFFTTYFSYMQNDRANRDFELRVRPYIVISSSSSSNVVSGKSADLVLDIKNVGILPAQITGASIYCGQNSSKTDGKKMIIGNGEVMHFNFSIFSDLKFTECIFLANYTVSVGLNKFEDFSTEYIFKFKDDSSLIYKNASIR